MRRHASDLFTIPDTLWRRAEMAQALRARDVGRVFQLVQQYAGVSQTQLAMACAMTQPKISGIIRGISNVEELTVFLRIADGLGMPDDARISLGVAPAGQQRPTAGRPEEEEDADPVQRRTFVGLTGAALFRALMSDSGQDPSEAIESIAAALAGPAVGIAEHDSPDVAALTRAVAGAKRSYQACAYSRVTRDLPPLLAQLRAACGLAGEHERSTAFRLSADAYHVAASVLLKAGDHGLAWLAADRSMHAARASGDPVSVGCSARILTHATMAGGHPRTAARIASTQAASFDHDLGAHSPESLSVYGSLLLRGASAAAQDEDRRTADELLTEAENAARRLGRDANLRWTGFGPTNARVHRVSIAVALGDAGTALGVARTVDLDNIDLTERKAAFLVDTARAFLQCGKHENAYLTLRAAGQIAPEEIADRPAVRQIVRDLAASAPPSIRARAQQLIPAGDQA